MSRWDDVEKEIVPNFPATGLLTTPLFLPQLAHNLALIIWRWLCNLGLKRYQFYYDEHQFIEEKNSSHRSLYSSFLVANENKKMANLSGDYES